MLLKLKHTHTTLFRRILATLNGYPGHNDNPLIIRSDVEYFQFQVCGETLKAISDFLIQLDKFVKLLLRKLGKDVFIISIRYFYISETFYKIL